MKQEKFIELLNLYLDGELKNAEATEFEQEILQNQDRRRIYRQYCQMQRACSVLADRFRDEAISAPAQHQSRVSGFARRFGVGRLHSVMLIASGAAAACFVFVAVRSSFVRRPDSAPADARTAVASAPAPVKTTLAVAASVPADSQSQSRIALFSNPWDRSNSPGRKMVALQPVSPLQSPFGVSAFLPSPVRSTNESIQLEWPTLSPDPNRAYHVQGPIPPEDVNMSAFQFQR